MMRMLWGIYLMEKKVDTRSAILDSAERLMADRGVDGVSLRAILGDAGANTAALHYHFGSREGVVSGVWERRGVRQVEREAEMLQALESMGVATVLDVVHVMVDPLVETLFEDGEKGRRFVRFLARLELDGNGVAEDSRGLGSGEVEERLGRVLVSACPDVPEAGLRRRLRLVMDSVVVMFANSEALGEEWIGDGGTEVLLEYVVTLKRFLVGGLSGSQG